MYKFKEAEKCDKKTWHEQRDSTDAWTHTPPLQLTDTQIFWGKNKIASWQVVFTFNWLIAQADTGAVLRGEQFLSNVSDPLHSNIFSSRHRILAVFKDPPAFLFSMRLNMYIESFFVYWKHRRQSIYVKPSNAVCLFLFL